MPDFTYDDLQSAILGRPNEHMVTQGGAMGADIFPKRAIGDMSNMASQGSIPPWLLPILMGLGFRGRNSLPSPRSQMQASRPRTEIGNMVRAHFGQDNRNPATGRNEFTNPVSNVTTGAMPTRGQLSLGTFLPQSRMINRGIENASDPNMRAQSFNPTYEQNSRINDAIHGRTVLTPANRTPSQSYSYASILQALRGNKPEGQ